MITGIILASGFSKRMKKDKLLMEVQGEILIEKVIKQTVESDLDKIILVYRKEEVKEIGEKYKIKTIYNENAHYGQSQSMKLGIREAGDSDAYMFFVGDQPFLTKELINKLIEEYVNNDENIVVPYYGDTRGMPMIISSKYKDELLKVEGDMGGREIVNNNPHDLRKIYISNYIQGIDIDNEEDLKSL